MSQIDQVREMLKNGAKIIDVRTPNEYASASYPGSINIPLDQLQSRIDELGEKDAPLVLHCQAGGRSEQARQFLMSQGFTNLINAGGIDDMRALDE